MNLNQLEKSKILSAKELDQKIKYWKFLQRKIVFTNGCFDLLHPGHIEYLNTARSFGHELIIGLNTDRSVRKLKASNRPINPEEDRAIMLAALESVSAICLFDEDTPLELIKMIQPDVLVKGGDYTKETIVGADEVESIGGKVEVIQFKEGYSSSKIIDKIRS